jgi:hypothetical protein
MSQTVFNDPTPLRYAADEGDIAEISLDIGRASNDFKGAFEAEILNESFNGCSLRIPLTDQLQVATECVCRVGKLAPIRAIVIRRKPSQQGGLELGFRYR